MPENVRDRKQIREERKCAVVRNVGKSIAKRGIKMAAKDEELQLTVGRGLWPKAVEDLSY